MNTPKKQTDPYIACQACGREWQDHPGVAHTCRLASDLASSLRWALNHIEPPEYTRDISEQEVYWHSAEEARRLVVEASNWKYPRP
jgi:hypothetical protein